jgi:hypothetical protein
LWSSYFALPAVAGMTGAHYHTQLFSVEMACCKCFWPDWPGIGILLILASHISWDDKNMPACLATGWHEFSITFCLGLDSNCDPPDLSLPRSWDYSPELPVPTCCTIFFGGVGWCVGVPPLEEGAKMKIIWTFLT